MTEYRRDYHADYDRDDPELSEHRDVIVADLHRRCPVARSDSGEGYWVVNGYEDVSRCAKDWRTFSSRDGFIAAGEVEIANAFANPLPQHVFSSTIAGMDVAEMPCLLEAFSFVAPPEERAQNFQHGMARIETYLKRRKGEPPRGDIIDAPNRHAWPQRLPRWPHRKLLDTRTFLYTRRLAAECPNAGYLEDARSLWAQHERMRRLCNRPPSEVQASTRTFDPK